MKIIFITVFFRILFLDSQTDETLTGVKVETNQGVYFSNLDGEVFIPTEEEVLSVSYVSYETKNAVTLSNDTIISLNQL
jgi:hypothetical protein